MNLKVLEMLVNMLFGESISGKRIKSITMK